MEGRGHDRRLEIADSFAFPPVGLVVEITNHGLVRTHSERELLAIFAPTTSQNGSVVVQNHQLVLPFVHLLVKVPHHHVSIVGTCQDLVVDRPI